MIKKGTGIAMAKKSPINGMQLKFAQEYVSNHGNGTRAAKKAGYKNPRVAASRLLTNDNIKAYIKKLQDAIDKKVTDKVAFTREEALQDFLTIKNRCLQKVEPLLDRSGNQVFTEEENGKLKPAFQFNALGAIAALREASKLMNLYPAQPKFEIKGNVTLKTQQAKVRT